MKSDRSGRRGRASRVAQAGAWDPGPAVLDLGRVAIRVENDPAWQLFVASTQHGPCRIRVRYEQTATRRKHVPDLQPK